MAPFVATVYTTVLGCISVYPVAVWREPRVQVEPGFWWWVLLIGSARYSRLMRDHLECTDPQGGVAKASLFLNLQPFVAMALGYITLGTPVSLTQVGGSVLIICGVVLATLQGTEQGKRLTISWNYPR